MASYTVLQNPIASTRSEKNSEFLTFLHPVDSREQAMTQVDKYRAQYPDASHVCWAYIIGDTRQPYTQAFSDDGEPSGTAGKPILHVLTERGAGNALAVVVRYFGGVKLGAGGLVRAYSAAVAGAVRQAELSQVIARVALTVVADFSHEVKIRYLVTQYEGVLSEVAYGAKVTVKIQLPANQVPPFTEQLSNETRGEAQIQPEA